MWLQEWHDEKVREHHCQFPFDDELPLPQDLTSGWECDECGAVYSVRIEGGWTGWWTSKMPSIVPDITVYKNFGLGQGKQYPRLYVMHEEWVSCGPSIVFTNKVKGNLPGNYYTTHVGYPHIPKPDWIAEKEGEVREKWLNKEIKYEKYDVHNDEVDAHNRRVRAEKGLTEPKASGSVTLTEKPKTKKRKWLMRE